MKSPIQCLSLLETTRAKSLVQNKLTLDLLIKKENSGPSIQSRDYSPGIQPIWLQLTNLNRSRIGLLQLISKTLIFALLETFIVHLNPNLTWNKTKPIYPTSPTCRSINLTKIIGFLMNTASISSLSRDNLTFNLLEAI